MPHHRLTVPSLLLVAATLSGCPEPPHPLGTVRVVTQGELDELAATGELMPVGEIDRDAEEAHRAAQEAEAEQVIDDWVSTHPEDADALELDFDDALDRLPDGNVVFPVESTGAEQIVQGPGFVRREVAAMLESLVDVEEQAEIVEALRPLIPEYCRGIVPAGEFDLRAQTPEQLVAINRDLSACYDEWRTFARPFGFDAGGQRGTVGDLGLDPTERATCGRPYEWIEGGGNDGEAGCMPTNALMTGFAFANRVPATRDQARRGTCVAFATASALEYGVSRRDGQFLDISEQYLYSIGKWDFEGNHYGDGLVVNRFLQGLQSTSFDVGLESAWGYNPAVCRVDDDSQYVDSCAEYGHAACSESAHQLGLVQGPDGNVQLWRPQAGQTVSVGQVLTLPAMVHTGLWGELTAGAALDAGYAVIASLTVKDDFGTADSDGYLTRGPSSKDKGGHAVHLVRIIPDPAADGGAWWVIKNSWGCGYGDSGYLYAPASWIQSHLKTLTVIVPDGIQANSAPTVTITSLPDRSEQAISGFGNTVRLTASVSDPDQPSCCTVTWFSTIDGALGTGNDLEVAVSGEGLRGIWATVRDDYGVLASDAVTLTLTNQAPEVEILRPTWTSRPGEYLGPRVPVGGNLAVTGGTSDPNQFGFPVDCSRQTWTFTAYDGSLIGTQSGCAGSIRPRFPGWIRVDYEATDVHGAVGSDSMWLQAVPWGPADLPFASIYEPAFQSTYLYDPNASISLRATAVSGTGTEPTIRWLVRHTFTGEEVELGTSRALEWVPSDSGVTYDSGTWALVLEATDDNGTTTDEVTLTAPVIVR